MKEVCVLDSQLLLSISSPESFCLLQVKSFFTVLFLWPINYKILQICWIWMCFIISITFWLHFIHRSTSLSSLKWRLCQDSWAFQLSLLASTSWNCQEGKLFIINSRANQLTPLLPVATCESEISATLRCSADQSLRNEDTSLRLPIYWTKFEFEGKFLIVIITEITSELKTMLDVDELKLEEFTLWTHWPCNCTRGPHADTFHNSRKMEKKLGGFSEILLLSSTEATSTCIAVFSHLGYEIPAWLFCFQHNNLAAMFMSILQRDVYISVEPIIGL